MHELVCLPGLSVVRGVDRWDGRPAVVCRLTCPHMRCDFRVIFVHEETVLIVLLSVLLRCLVVMRGYRDD